MALLTNEQITKLNHDIDESYKNELRFEISQNVRQQFINWGRKSPGAFFFAVYSMSNGAYDDLKKDVIRGRITIEQSSEILDKMLEYRLINQFLHDLHVTRIEKAKSECAM